jgi:molybdopterin synthase sulfur carrier subunit
VKVLYFAWLRQKIGRGEETVEVPSNVQSVGDLVAWLRARGDGYADAFADLKRIRAALNQEHVDFAAPVTANDEVAFFPPVTGG